MKTLQEIEVREAEIGELVNADETNETKMTVDQIESLTAELESLKTERAAILDKQEKRQALINAALTGKGKEVEKQKEDNKPMEIREYIATEEYRNAWLTACQKADFTQLRTGEIALTNAAAVIPLATQQMIFEKMVQIAPILNEITLLRVNGNVRFAVEGVNNAAALHTENAQITPAADTMLYVDLAGFEIVKLVRISAAVSSMSIAAFEGFITDQIAKALARKIEEYLIVGTGSSQPKGLDKSNTWSDGTNGVDWSGAQPTAAELIELASYLKGGYAVGAKWVMNWTTFLQDVYALRDDAKYPLVKEVNGGYTMLNKPILFSDYCPVGEIYFGDLKNIVANLAADIVISVSKDSGFAYNAIDYRGACVFDSKIALAEAFVKGEATLA